MERLRKIFGVVSPYILSELIRCGMVLLIFMLVEACFISADGTQREIPKDILLLINLGTTMCVQSAFIYVFGKWYQEVHREETDEKKRIKAADVLFFAVLSLVLQVIVMQALNRILPFFPEANAEYTTRMEHLTFGGGILTFLLTGILAPIGEELLFRGVTISLGRKAMPFWIVNILQAALFGVYHQNVVQGMYAFACGLVLGGIFYKYKNINACILVHAFINIWGNIISGLI